MIPSIDLLDGKVVVLQQGKKKIIESKEDPVAIAEKLSAFKEVQVIDLNAALGTGNNFALTMQICRRVNARFGGGIRTKEKAAEAIRNGAKKLIVGTCAEKKFLSELCRITNKERIIAALDSKNGKIVVNGWQNKTNWTMKEKVTELEGYCGEFLFSFVEKDGTMGGIDLKRIKRLKNLTNNKITIVGGISSKEDTEKLENIGVDCVVGMAFYTGKIGGLK